MEKLTKNELKSLIKASMVGGANVNFADAQVAARKALLEYFGLDINQTISTRDLKNMNFSIIEEIIDEIMPGKLEDILGAFANIKQYGRDEEVKYTIKNIGKGRAKMSILPGARGGIYKARRLDDKNVFLPTKVYTVGLYLSLEELILGKITFGELLANITEGMVEKVYTEIVAALRAAKTLAPAANREDGEFVTTEIDAIVRIVAAYGRPVILCFESIASKFNNIVPWSNANPNVNVSDIDAWKSQGYVGLYKGTTVVKLPNFLVDATNTNWAFDEKDIFILPADEKPVLVALKGEATMVEFTHPSGSVEWNMHKIMGVGVISYQNIGIYTDTTA